MSIADAIENVNKTKEDEYVFCRDKAHAESVRVSAFNYRKRLESLLGRKETDKIGITKIEENGQYFIRVYIKDSTELQHYERNAEGKLVPVVNEDDNVEKQKIIEKMREDGMSEEEIEAYWKEG